MKPVDSFPYKGKTAVRMPTAIHTRWYANGTMPRGFFQYRDSWYITIDKLTATQVKEIKAAGVKFN